MQDAEKQRMEDFSGRLIDSLTTIITALVDHPGNDIEVCHMAICINSGIILSCGFYVNICYVKRKLIWGCTQ